MYIEVNLKQAELHDFFWKDDFTGCEILRKLRFIYLQVNSKKTDFN